MRHVDVFVRNKTISYAHKLILWWKCVVCMSVIFFFFLQMDASSGSMKTAKSNGKSGHPCLVPR